VCFDTLRASVGASAASGAITLAASVREYAANRAPRLQQPPSSTTHNSAPGKLLVRSGSTATGSADNSASLDVFAVAAALIDSTLGESEHVHVSSRSSSTSLTTWHRQSSVGAWCVIGSEPICVRKAVEVPCSKGSADALVHPTPAVCRCTLLCATPAGLGSRGGQAHESGTASDGAVPSSEPLAAPSWSMPGATRRSQCSYLMFVMCSSLASMCACTAAGFRLSGSLACCLHVGFLQSTALQ
jgi:hypothetical protein